VSINRLKSVHASNSKLLLLVHTILRHVCATCTFHCTSIDIVIGLSDVTVVCGHITVSMLWVNTLYCVKLSGENLSRYSNKIESVGLRK